ncbi:MAG: sulfoxide reductase heme-binding subunit YedZ [Gemmatimonadota bacterium]|nr:sulfoxide reductase heme-binding subunit YedZ [Gemmatimonadota bacterium]
MTWSAAWVRVRALSRPRWWPWLVWCAVLGPGLLVAAALLSDLLRDTRWLGANPVKEGELRLGTLTIQYLAAALAITPLRRWLGWNWLQRDRRTFGLAAFCYGLAHFLWYALLDLQLDLAQLGTDLSKRTYIVVGFAALLVMLPLALTSTRAAIARLKARWVKLHRLTYVVPVLGVTHWWMSVKADVGQPALYSVLFAVLLGWRWWHARRDNSLHATTTPARAGSH